MAAQLSRGVVEESNSQLRELSLAYIAFLLVWDLKQPHSAKRGGGALQTARASSLL